MYVYISVHICEHMYTQNICLNMHIKNNSNGTFTDIKLGIQQEHKRTYQNNHYYKNKNENLNR